MATCTFALDTTNTYDFEGFGCHLPLYEKGATLTNYGGDLTDDELTRLCDEVLPLFTWARAHVDGGELAIEGPHRDKFYPGKKQASLLAEINRRWGPFRYQVSPFGAPSVCMEEGQATTLRPGGTELDVDILDSEFFARQQIRTDDASWQVWLDSIDDGLQILANCGVGFDDFQVNGEWGHTGGVANYWSALYSGETLPTWIRKIWLGEGLTGGGIKARWPQLRTLTVADPIGSRTENLTPLLSDATALSEVSGLALNLYNGGITSSATFEQQVGLGGLFTQFFGGCIVSESGLFADVDPPSGITSGQLKLAYQLWHEAIVYGHCRIVNMWTILRDVTAKRVADSRGVFYTAKPLADLDTATGTFTFTPLWWCLKPLLQAAGRGNSTAYAAAPQTSNNFMFTPATGAYINLFRRTSDNKLCLCYANFSGASRSDTVLFTRHAAAANLSGTRVDYTATTGDSTAPAAVSTSSGAITLSGLADNRIALLELTEAA